MVKKKLKTYKVRFILGGKRKKTGTLRAYSISGAKKQLRDYDIISVKKVKLKKVM